jgi:hypothetical protein
MSTEGENDVDHDGDSDVGSERKLEQMTTLTARSAAAPRRVGKIQ